MKTRSAIGCLVLFLGGAGLWAWAIEVASRQGDRAPSVPITLGGFLVAAVATMVVFRLPAWQANRVEFGANLRRAEGKILNAGLLSSVGSLVFIVGTGVVNVVGFILASAGVVMMAWCLIRAVPPRHADPRTNEVGSPRDPS